MKFSYKLVGSGSWVLFADVDAGDIIADFPPDFTGLIQEEPAFQSSAMIRRNQGNVKCSLALSISKNYADEAAALASIRTTAGLMDQIIHLRIEHKTETQYYPNAILAHYNGKWEGREAHHNLQFGSDNVTATAPTT